MPGYTTLTTPEGETYYVNNQTGESRWDRPPPAHFPPPAAPPPTLTGSTGPVGGGPGPDSRGDVVDLTIAKGAVAAIVVSLFLPYFSYFFLEVSGFEMIVYIAEMLAELFAIGDEVGGGGSGAGGGGPPGLGPRFSMLLLGGLMFLFSPIVFLLTALVGGISVFSNGTLPKLIGKIHLGYFGIMLILLFIGGTLLGDLTGEIGFSMFSVLGIGFWIGGLSGIGFIYDNS